MSGTIPTPAFKIGDTVWTASTTREDRSHPCPDCFGSKRWKAITPAGDEFEASCLRCTRTFTDPLVVPLGYSVWTGSAQRHTVSGIQLCTTGDRKVKYALNASDRCHEDEGRLYGTEAEALLVADARAAQNNADNDRTPERLVQRHVSELTLKDAAFNRFDNGLWNAWYAYRRLRENVDAMLDEPGSKAELVEALKSELRFEDDYNDKDNPLVRLVGAIHETLAGGDEANTALRIAFDALPELLRRERKPAPDPYAFLHEVSAAGAPQ